MVFDNFTLFGANVIMLGVIAVAYVAAERGREDEPYWRTWTWANLALIAGILGYMFELGMPDFLRILMPNGLLLLGFGLRWRAAREFNDRPAAPEHVYGPLALFAAVCVLPPIYNSYGAVYTIMNILLTAQALATAYEFWRDREDALFSRYGLIAAYGLMGFSFAIRVGQGFWQGASMGRGLPDDALLNFHLIIALVYTAASGAFALSVAYERGAATLRRTALCDELTGLFNRRAFDDKVRTLLAARETGPFAVALFDLDHFKRINDVYGHAAGDAALQAFARICTESLRDTDFLARIGGEEFAVVLPRTSEGKALAVVERIRTAVKGQQIAYGDARFGLTFSAGVYHSSSGAEGYDTLMRVADDFLYEAKKAGRDTVVSHPADAGSEVTATPTMPA